MAQKFDDFMCNLIESKLFYITIFIIGGLLWGIINFYSVDYMPATESDYNSLLQVQESIVSNFDSVYTFNNTDIDITDETIIVCIDNDECALKSYFNKNKQYLYTEKFDKADFSYTTNIIVSIICGVLGGILTIGLMFILLFVITAVLELIDSIRNKTNKKKKYGGDIDH